MSHIREASSLILASAAHLITNMKHISEEGMRILTIIRSEKMSHFPNSCTFPGGNIDKHDCNDKWLEILPESEAQSVQLNIVNPDGHETNNTYLGNVSKAIFFRICAIREAFEECGILLCRRNDSSRESAKVTHLEIKNKEIWREKVRNNAEEFLNLCLTHKCYPDVKNLYLWSNWCTPVHLPRRYNTVFFLALLNGNVVPEADLKEVQDTKWRSVDECLLQMKNHEIFLPPPQFYEFHRLKKFPDIFALETFLNTDFGNNQRCQQYLPVYANSEKGLITLLPGDEKYKLTSSVDTTSIFEDVETYQCKTMHRMEYKDEFECHVIVQNYTCPFSHVLPDSSHSCATNKL